VSLLVSCGVPLDFLCGVTFASFSLAFILLSSVSLASSLFVGCLLLPVTVECILAIALAMATRTSKYHTEFSVVLWAKWLLSSSLFVVSCLFLVSLSHFVVSLASLRVKSCQ